MKKREFQNLFPRGFWSWVEVILRWAFGNVFLGSIAMLVSMLTIALGTKPWVLPADFVLAITVLAMTIAATSAEGLEDSENGLLKVPKAWLRRLTIVVLVVGTLVAVLKTPSDLLQDGRVDNHIALRVSLILLGAAIIIGFVSHLVQLKGRDDLVVEIVSATVQSIQQTEDYANREKNMTDTIQQIAAKITIHDGAQY